MADHQNYAGLLGIKVNGTEMGTILAGVAGSLITLRFLGPLPWYERIIVVLSGAAASYWMTPLAAYALSIGPTETGVRDSLSFLIGSCGMAMLYAVLVTLSAYNANPLDWLRVILHKAKAP